MINTDTICLTGHQMCRKANDRRAGSLGFAEAMLLYYNKKSRNPLKLEKLYSHKMARKRTLLIFPISMPVHAEKIDNDTNEANFIECSTASTYSFSTRATIAGDRVRLRKYVNETNLEQLSYGETVLVDVIKTVTDGSFNTWYYCKRVKTGTVGYVAGKYLKFN